jgi:predicted PurR-regulated permease PerM
MTARPGNIIARVTGVFTGIIGVFTYLFVSIFVGFYIALNPRTYSDVLIRLFPRGRRVRMRQILGDTVHSLKSWLIGRILSMVIVGVTVTLGLWLLDVPFPLVLGLAAGVLSFIPIIGPVIGAVPVVLIASTRGPATLAYAIVLYLAVQIVETYLLTPMIQRRTVGMPPAFAFMAQLLMGVLGGPMGVAFAFPLAVVGLVLVKKLYVEDVLGDSVTLPVAVGKGEKQTFRSPG